MECRDDVYLLMLCQAGGDVTPADDKILSSIIVARNKSSQPLLSQICPLYQVLGRLYRAIVSSIDRYRAAFNDPRAWFDVKRYDLLDQRETADRLLEKIYSKKMERILILEKNFRI